MGEDPMDQVQPDTLLELRKDCIRVTTHKNYVRHSSATVFMKMFIFLPKHVSRVNPPHKAPLQGHIQGYIKNTFLQIQ